MKQNKFTSFFSEVCIFFTILLIAKFILEYFLDPFTWDHTRSNIVVMFFICVLSAFVLEQHKRFEKLPMLLVLPLQYLIALSVVMLFVWYTGRYEELSEYAYRDIFLSFTIPYIFGAAWYYLSLIHEAKRANEIVNQVIKRNDEFINRMREKE